MNREAANIRINPIKVKSVKEKSGLENLSEKGIQETIHS